MLSNRRTFSVAALALSISAVPAQADTIRVTIEKLVFSPADIHAKVGDTIEWVNTDLLAHTASVKGGWEVLIPAGKSARFLAKKVEAAEYYCRFHPNMKGRIIVTAP